MTTCQDQSRSPSRRSRPHKRATVACKACHGRKVRCNVALSGIPCANCAADGVACEIAQRKRRINPDQLCITPHSLQSNSTSPEYSQHHPQHEGDDISKRRYHTGLETNETASNTTGFAPGHVSGSWREDPINGTHGSPSLYYLGDERGSLSLLVNICRDDTFNSSKHVFLPMKNPTTLTPQDLQYLKQTGCFNLPSREMQDALLRAYFHNVHAFAPVIDVADFVYQYTTGQASVLLLWSMFAAAGSFIDEKLPTGELGATRIEIKETSFQRAKALYELEYEKDNIVLIQSTYLMSYRLASLDDNIGPWYWLGISINLAYTAGLHCFSFPESPNASTCQLRLCIQLWWSIYCREVWFSLGCNRPVRILLDQVTTPIPTQVQTAPVSEELPHEIHRKYFPYEIDDLVQLWGFLVKISATLGNVLSSFYTSTSPGPTRQQMDSMEHEIAAHQSELPSGSHRTQLMMVYLHQIRLYHEATMTILYLHTNQSLRYKRSNKIKHEDSSLQSLCLRKMRASALRMTHLINIMFGEGLTTHVQLITVIAIVPSMTVHLINLMSSSQPTSQAGEHNLHLCMMLLENLRTAHVYAQLMHRLFKTAIAKIKNKSIPDPYPLLTSGSWSTHASSSTSTSGSEHRSINDDETGFPSIRENLVVTPPGLSYLDMLPLMSPDGEFSLHE